MRPISCSFCKGNLEEGVTNFIAQVNDQVVIIEDVPAWICDNCGEAYYSIETSEKIDLLRQKIEDGTYYARPIAAGAIKLSEITS